MARSALVDPIPAASPSRPVTREPRRLIERFAPGAEIGESHDVLIHAPADLVFEVAEDFDLMSMPSIYWIFWLRARMLGAPIPHRDDLAGLVAETSKMGWGELARRPGRELVMGASVQPWLAEPVFEPVPPERFLTHRDADHVKIVWTLEAEPLGPDLTRFRTETRVVPTDEAAARRFRRYWRVAGTGIVLIRLLALPAIRREAERRARESPPEDAGATTRSPGKPALVERFLPDFAWIVVRETRVDAPPDLTYEAVTDTNLLDPLVRALFAVRELRGRFARRLRGKGVPRTPASVTVRDLLRPETGMMRLAETPGEELVVGSVGRFWERDYGHRTVPAEAFASFAEPGYAKLVMDIQVHTDGEGGSLLRYEARTATTDDDARRRFRRYWRVIRPGVWFVMGRAIALIRREAERRQRHRAAVIPRRASRTRTPSPHGPAA